MAVERKCRVCSWSELGDCSHGYGDVCGVECKRTHKLEWEVLLSEAGLRNWHIWAAKQAMESMIEFELACNENQFGIAPRIQIEDE